MSCVNLTCNDGTPANCDQPIDMTTPACNDTTDWFSPYWPTAMACCGNPDTVTGAEYNLYNTNGIHKYGFSKGGMDKPLSKFNWVQVPLHLTGTQINCEDVNPDWEWWQCFEAHNPPPDYEGQTYPIYFTPNNACAMLAEPVIVNGEEVDSWAFTTGGIGIEQWIYENPNGDPVLGGFGCGSNYDMEGEYDGLSGLRAFAKQNVMGRYDRLGTGTVFLHPWKLYNHDSQGAFWRYDDFDFACPWGECWDNDPGPDVVPWHSQTSGHGPTDGFHYFHHFWSEIADIRFPWSHQPFYLPSPSYYWQQLEDNLLDLFDKYPDHRYPKFNTPQSSIDNYKLQDPTLSNINISWFHDFDEDCTSSDCGFNWYIGYNGSTWLQDSHDYSRPFLNQQSQPIMMYVCCAGAPAGWEEVTPPPGRTSKKKLVNPSLMNSGGRITTNKRTNYGDGSRFGGIDEYGNEV